MGSLMKRSAILGLCCALAAGCAQTRVVHDNSVASKFTGLNKAGWSVTGGGVNKPKAGTPSNVKVLSSTNPLSNPVWKTNFRVDSPEGPAVPPGGFEPPPPATPGSPLLGGYVLPQTGASPSGATPSAGPLATGSTPATGAAPATRPASGSP